MGRYYMPGNDSEKRWVLSFCLNVDSVTDDVTSDGRLFQVFAAATQNARLPTVWRHVCGTARSADDAERKRCRPGRSATWRRLSFRYVGTRPLRHWNASTASLKDIRCGARSQCSRWSRGMIWSNSSVFSRLCRNKLSRKCVTEWRVTCSKIMAAVI